MSKTKKFSLKCYTVCFTAYGKDVEDDSEAYLRCLASTCDWVLGQQECCPDTKRIHSLYEKPMNKWWDGYNLEDNVLIDDFDKQGTCLGHYLKIWGDRYFGWKGETKGGTIKPNFKRIIITSNYHPDELWGGPTGDPQLVEAITRRFKLVKMAKGELEEDIGDI